MGYRFKPDHELKTWPEFYKAVEEGSKNFEIRKNDRDFKVNECLLLQEFDPERKKYTGQQCTRWIKYVLHGGQFGLVDGYCILGF